MRIYYLSSDEQADNLLQQQIGIKWTPFDINNKVYKGYDAVLLVEPYECKAAGLKSGKYSSVYKLWKRFLAEIAPEQKLLITGFEDIAHPNYIQLLDINAGNFDWATKIKQAKAANEDWEKEIKVNGVEVLNRLKVFFEGHNHQGIVDTLAHIRRGLNNAEIHYLGNEELQIEQHPFLEVWERFLQPIREPARLLVSRWNNYKHFFQMLPFHYNLEECKADAFIQELNAFLSLSLRLKEDKKIAKLAEKETTYKTIQAYSRIAKLIKAFSKISKQYIHIHKTANIILIDDDKDFHRQVRQSFPNYAIKSAYTKAEGQDLVQSYKTDLILLDLNIDTQEQDGLQLLPCISEHHPNIPVSIVSTVTNEETIQKALNLGAKHYLSKTNYDVQTWSGIFAQILEGESFTLEAILKTMEIQEAPSILVIDDEREWFESIAQLKRANTCMWANTAMQARDLIAKNPYDLILLDLVLDEYTEDSGFDLLDEIRAKDTKTPVIVITKVDETANAVKAIQKGANYFLRKDQYDASIWQQTIKLVLQANQN